MPKRDLWDAPYWDSVRTFREFTKGYVYFVQGEISRHIKIGYTSKEPKVRLCQLQVGSSEKLHLLGAFWGNEDVEQFTQAKWRKNRIHGEWFEESPELLEFIKKESNA